MEPGAFEVAPGVHRIPLPLPNDGLRAVNVYAIADGDELVLIDSGWALDEARDRLEQALGAIGHGFESISRFLVTHVHRDHYTLGVTLRKTFGSRVSLGIGEQPSLEAILHGRVEGQLNDLVRWGAADIAERMREGMKRGGPRPDGYERPDEWISGETEIRLNTRTLKALPTPGHTAGHLVYVDADSSLLFAGDHILPHITPSIGFELVRQELPLGDYLDSLRLVRDHPDMRLLPAHGPVADSTHVRVDELLDHHRRRLDETERALGADEATAAEVAARMGWTRHNRKLSEMDTFNRMLAIGETSAHLDVLVRDGRLIGSTVDGIARYTA
jgi:glyoxylase-like metal-dependent hydrolase (beta-lactamase superfamily II)